MPFSVANVPVIDYTAAARQQGEAIDKITQGTGNLATGIDKLAEISKLQANKRLWITKGNQALNAMLPPDEFPELYKDGTAWWMKHFNPDNPSVTVEQYNSVIGNVVEDALNKRELKKLHPDKQISPVYADAYLNGLDAKDVVPMRTKSVEGALEQETIKGLQGVAGQKPQTAEDAKRMAAGQYPIGGGMAGLKDQQNIAGGFATQSRYIADAEYKNAMLKIRQALAKLQASKTKLDQDKDKHLIYKIIVDTYGLIGKNGGLTTELTGMEPGIVDNLNSIATELSGEVGLPTPTPSSAGKNAFGLTPPPQ